MNKSYIDTNGCPSSFHFITRNDEGTIIAKHVDDEQCEVTEFDLSKRE